MSPGQPTKSAVAHSRYQVLFIFLPEASLQHFANGSPFASAQFRSLPMAYHTMLGLVPGPRRFDQAFEIVWPVARLNPKKSKESERPDFLINVIFKIKNGLFGPQLIEGVDVVGITFECLEAFFKAKTSPPEIVRGETVVGIAQKERDFAVNFVPVGRVEPSELAPLG